MPLVLLRNWLVLLVLMFAAMELGGCSSKPAERTTREVTAERAKLQGLFMTAGGKRREAAIDSPPSVDPQTKEIYWPALECTNPDCPGRTKEGPFLFVHPSPGVIVGADGKIQSVPIKPEEYRPAECPKCLAIRNQSGESESDKQQYLAFVRPYTLLETEQKKKALEAESKRMTEGPK